MLSNRKVVDDRLLRLLIGPAVLVAFAVVTLVGMVLARRKNRFRVFEAVFLAVLGVTGIAAGTDELMRVRSGVETNPELSIPAAYLMALLCLTGAAWLARSELRRRR